MADERLKQHRLYAFKKIIYELSKKITPEELMECFENTEPKQWGYGYRDLESDYDMKIITKVIFTSLFFRSIILYEYVVFIYYFSNALFYQPLKMPVKQNHI